jgi:hypothetical protein
MPHDTKIVEYKKLSDGQFAVSVSCCDEPAQISWLTVDASIVIDPVKFQAALDGHIERVVLAHEGALQADTTLAGLVGTIITTDDQGKVRS